MKLISLFLLHDKEIERYSIDTISNKNKAKGRCDNEGTSKDKGNHKSKGNNKGKGEGARAKARREQGQ